MKLVVKEPGKEPEIKDFNVDRSLLSIMQGIVGGYVQHCSLSSDVAILCNEDGIAENLAENCGYLGTIVFVGLAESEWCGLTQEQTRKAIVWCHLHKEDKHPGDSGFDIIFRDEEIRLHREKLANSYAQQCKEWESL